ncbi:hypothetical protein [Desulfomarina sp.]
MQKKQNRNDARNIYTCSEYREEMTLLALKRKLAESRLDNDEKSALEQEIAELEHRIGM